MLLDKGADINIRGGNYCTALQAASINGHYKVVQILLDRGADVNALDGGIYGNALQAASYKGHHEVARLLLNHNALIKRKDIQGRTAFHLASAGAHMETIELLLSFGSDPTTIDLQGRNALHHAASMGSIGIVNWLLRKGFDPNHADRDGWTSLHWAARNSKSVSIRQFLKAAGARSTTVEAIEGWTPDEVAIFHHKDPLSRSRENEKSELVGKQDLNSSTAAVESIHDESKVSPGIQHDGCYCDGCFLVRFDLSKCSGVLLSDMNRTYTVRVTNARNAQILTTVSNARIHRMRPTLVIGLRKLPFHSILHLKKSQTNP